MMKSGYRSYLLKVTLLAALYFGAARVGLLFSPDTGNFFLIWPPTGLALATLLLLGYRLWPGIALGAFLATASTGAPLSLALTNTIGSLVEILLAVYLLRQVEFDRVLAHVRDMIRLVLFGAGIGPILGATMSVAGLCLAGSVPWSAYFSIWRPWWLSHAIGVLILTPVLLVVAQRAQKQAVTEAFLFPLASFLLGIALVASLAIWRSEEQYLHTKLHNEAGEIVREIELEVEKNVQYLVAIDGLYAASEEVERSEFKAFAARLLNYMPTAQVLEWIPRVPQDEREAYEQAARQDGFPDFEFTEQDAGGQFSPASARPEYFPVYFLEPYTGNETTLGFDLGSDPAQLEAIIRARDTGQPAATTPIAQMPETDPQKRLSIFLPVYRNNTPANSIETRRTNLQGFISGVFCISDIVTRALNNLPPRDVELFLFDTTSPGNAQLLTHSACLSGPSMLAENSELASGELQTALHYTSSFNVSGRTWLAVIHSCPAYSSGGHGWGAWAVLAIGLLLSGAIVAYVSIRQQSQLQIAFQKTLLECQLEASLDGILIVSKEREWLYYNQRFVEMWGIPPEVIATRSGDATVAHVIPLLAEPEAALADLEYLQDHLTEVTRKEFVLKDGRIFEHYRAPVVSAEGKHHGYLWNYRDITRRRQLEAQLLQAQKMEAIGRLAGGIAHDFNNILMPITLYAEMAMIKLSPDSELYADLQEIRESVARAAELTRQILAFSRKQVLEMRVLDLNTIVAELEKMLLHLIREDIKLQTILDPTLRPINADKGQIEQVLMNLVVNARDAMPTGGELVIETANVYLDEAYVRKYAGAQEVGYYAMLSVSDTGYGMDDETQRQLFEPFFTTKEKGKGTGLGLATVFGIIKQHKGNIWVYSEPGKGTTFKIYLPCVEDVTQTPETTTTEPISTCGTETILVAEDEKIVRQLICETLAAHGYEILEAQDPNHALQLASEHKNSLRLLLTDVIMPEMNGRELYQKVAAIQPDVSVLYMSGYTDNVIVHQGILDKGVNFIQKPFTVLDLTQKVRQVLD